MDDRTPHTPGPWARNINPTYPIYAEKDHRKIAFALVGKGVTEAEAMANLDLIAAAPDLLAALESVTEALEEAHDTHIYGDGDEHEDDCSYCAAAEKARAVIANAEGRF